MLKIFHSLYQMDVSQLLAVYIEENQRNGSSCFRNLSPNEQLIRAEDSFLSYLREVFFRQKDATYVVWVVDGCYKAAFRLEEYCDGLLLTSLETAPDSRRKGYAHSLMLGVVEYLKNSNHCYLYSHVSKRNKASLALHIKCGFEFFSDTASFLDGTVTHSSYTLRLHL